MKMSKYVYEIEKFLLDIGFEIEEMFCSSRNVHVDGMFRDEHYHLNFTNFEVKTKSPVIQHYWNIFLTSNPVMHKDYYAYLKKDSDKLIDFTKNIVEQANDLTKD